MADDSLTSKEVPEYIEIKEKTANRLYDAFKKQNDKFLGFIEGLPSAADKQSYASLILNRLIFVYFIQKRGFLDGDINYLKNRLVQAPMEFEKVFEYFEYLHEQSCRFMILLKHKNNFHENGPGLNEHSHENSTK